MSTGEKNVKVGIPELVKRISADSGKSKASTMRLIKALLGAVQDGLVKDGLVRLDGFGSFALQWHAGRTTKHPKTGKPVEIPGQTRVIFRPSVMLRRQVNTPYEQIVIDVIPDKLAEIKEALDLSEDAVMAPIITSVQNESSETVLPNDVQHEESDHALGVNSALVNDAPEIELDKLPEHEPVSISESDLYGQDYGAPEIEGFSNTHAENETGNEFVDPELSPNIIDAKSIGDKTIDDAPEDNGQVEGEVLIPSVTNDEEIKSAQQSVHAPEIFETQVEDAVVSDDLIADQDGPENETVLGIKLPEEKKGTNPNGTVYEKEIPENDEKTNFDASTIYAPVSDEADSYLPTELGSRPDGGASENKSDIIEYPVTQSEEIAGNVSSGGDYSEFDLLTSQDAGESLAEIESVIVINPPELESDEIPPFGAGLENRDDVILVGALVSGRDSVGDAPEKSSLAWMDVSEVAEEKKRGRRPIPKRHTKSSVPQIITGAVGITAALIFGNMLIGSLLSSDNTENGQVKNTAITTSASNATSSTLNTTRRNVPPAMPTSFKNANLTVSARELSAGDNLWNMAEKKYADPTLWPVIYGVNQKDISNPDQVTAGESIDIPELDLNTENLSAKDRRVLSLGYLRVYQAYQQAGSPEAIDYLKVANQYDAGFVQENRAEIDQQDFKALKK